MPVLLRSDVFVLVVPTRTLDESVRFYRDALGLRLLEEWAEMGRGALFAASDDAQVELLEMEDAREFEEPCVGFGLQISGVDEVYERLVAAGARLKAPPRLRAWGMYGFGTFDPNGVPINVYEPRGVEEASL